MKIKDVVGKLDKTLLLLGALVLIAIAATLWKGGWQLTVFGFVQAGQLFQTIWFRLILGFTLGGLIQVLIPRALIANWLGRASGLKGILIGSYIGAVIPGGPYVTMPVIASIYSAGAGAGPVIALLTSRALLGIEMLIIWQIPFLGVEISLARYIVCLFVPPLVGLVGAAMFQMITKLPQAASISDHSLDNVEQQPDGTGEPLVAPEKEEKV